jgi:hypothetical protein
MKFPSAHYDKITGKTRSKRDPKKKLIGGDNGGTFGPTTPGLAPWEPGKLFNNLPDAYKCGH